MKALHSHAYHDALKQDLPRFRVECEFRYVWDFGDHALNMWQCRACKSDLAGPSS